MCVAMTQWWLGACFCCKSRFASGPKNKNPPLRSLRTDCVGMPHVSQAFLRAGGAPSCVASAQAGDAMPPASVSNANRHRGSRTHLLSSGHQRSSSVADGAASWKQAGLALLHPCACARLFVLFRLFVCGMFPTCS